ncbi:MAG: TonB family protein [Candidatus Acidiferrales bacterium]
MREREDFSQCLVDADKQSLDRARWIRREALMVSIILEAALVAVMFLLPLITQGLPPQQFLITPAPPYHGGSSSAPAGPRAAPHHQATETFATTYNVLSLHNAHIQSPAPAISSDDAPSIDSSFGSGGSLGSGPEGGEDIPGGLGARPIPEPPKPKAEQPRPISEGVMEAALLNKVQPQYPAAARLMHIAGTVRLQAIIGKDGRVRGVQVLSGHPLLVQAALAAVREWRYRPTELNHEIVEVETEITVNFVLE